MKNLLLALLLISAVGCSQAEKTEPVTETNDPVQEMNIVTPEGGVEAQSP